jgi:hypothetical protein
MTPIEELIEFCNTYILDKENLKIYPNREDIRTKAKDLLNKETQMLDQLKTKRKEDVIEAYMEGKRNYGVHSQNEVEQYYKRNFETVQIKRNKNPNWRGE